MCLTEALQDISNWLTYFHYIFFIKIFLDFIFKNQFFSAAYSILHNILDRTWTFFFFYLSQLEDNFFFLEDNLSPNIRGILKYSPK